MVFWNPGGWGWDPGMFFTYVRVNLNLKRAQLLSFVTFVECHGRRYKVSLVTKNICGDTAKVFCYLTLCPHTTTG
jgi:hypothetical protein